MTMYDPHSSGPVGPRGQVKSIVSILAIVCALASLFFAHNAAARFGLAVAGVLLGLLGMLKALSPRVSGGILSMAAIVIAVLGLLWAIIDTVT
jgi:hypothetical protein